MISVPVRNLSGQEVGVYEFDPEELSPSISKQLLHDVVVMHEANRRVGTSKTKSRGQVRGSTRKLFRQKGTGRARAGSSRTPVRRGGGHTFAKKPLDWSYRLPKKAVKRATRMALLSKFLDNEVTLIDELSLESPRTKLAASVLKSLELSSTSCLLVLEQHDPEVLTAFRNIPTVWVSSAININTYELLHQKQLLITKGAIDQLRAVGQPTVAG